MTKTKLTSDMTFEILGVISIPIVILISILNYQFNLEVVLILIAIFAFAGYLIYWLLTMKTIDFDSDNIYISNKDNEEIIPIQNINFIKLTVDAINKKSFWKLKYTDNNNELKELMFVPKLLTRELFILQDLIKTKNPNAIIENIATSFDKE